jgi:hypothetical protein
MSFAPAARGSHDPGDAAPVVDEAGVADREHPRLGETVKAKVDTVHLHLFDGTTGLRVGE